jgi:hypothetical protein
MSPRRIKDGLVPPVGDSPMSVPAHDGGRGDADLGGQGANPAEFLEDAGHLGSANEVQQSHTNRTFRVRQSHSQSAGGLTTLLDVKSGEIIAALKAYRVPQARIAAVIGRDRTAANKMLQGKRSIKVNEIEPLTKLVEDVMREHGGVAPHPEVVQPPVRSLSRDLAGLPIRDAIQAGAWLEVEPVSQIEYPVADTYPASPDPRFPRAAQWIRAVRGDSMNALTKNGQPAGILDGDHVHVVDAYAIGYKPVTGDIVEVERSRFSGREYELTIKQVEVTDDGRVLLWPRSTNPRWQQAIPFVDTEGANEHVEVRISGKVLQVLRQF